MMRPARHLPMVLRLLAALAAFWPGLAGAAALVETPALAEAVKAGELPPVGERVPSEPRVVDLAAEGLEPGRSGGSLRMLMGEPNDVRMMVVYGYSRLVGLNARLEIEPDILAKVDVEEGRVFTLHLRPGHKWSDGEPFTAEDFRYFWEDVATDPDLSPAGPPIEMRPDGDIPRFEVVDPVTVRYTWSRPNPQFLPALAGARPLYITMPAHFMRKFHKKYASAEDLEKRIKKAKVKDWTGLHARMARQYRPENPDLPTLDPWHNTTKGPAQEYVFERNPYYHRVDAGGHQLPYLDKITLSLGSTSLIPAKAGSGESDLQARYVRFADYTFLKEAEKRHGFAVRLWETTRGSQVCIRLNLTVKDPVWRALFHDVRVRRALSLAIDRHEINNVIFFGLAQESADTVLAPSPLFKPELKSAWSRFDPAEASRLLDEAGLAKRDSDGVRLLPDGRRAEIIIESSGESTEETDVLELIHDTWLAAGIKLYTKPSQAELLRQRVLAGETMASVAQGIDNAIPTADFSPAELVPSNQVQYQWPDWGLYAETGGKKGNPPDIEEVKRLSALFDRWRHTPGSAERRQIWDEILALYADQVLTIGTVNATLQPVVVRNSLRNVPAKGLFGFEPTAYFGIYRPDTFWLDDQSTQ